MICQRGWLLGQDSNPSADGNSPAGELTATQYVLPDPFPTPAAFQFALAVHRLTPGRKLFMMHQPPRTRMTLGVESSATGRVVELGKATGEIISMPDIDLALGVE